MKIKLYATFRGHEPILSYRMDRAAAYRWVVEHRDDLSGLLVDCGLNVWSWDPDLGWMQQMIVEYDSSGLHGKDDPTPRIHGNGLHARHPWRYCMGDCTTLNPLAGVPPTYDCPF